tara:strand:- start:2279 stop:2566 length:288 start_codon:yes stop_codon:yes gene_type:complete
MAMKKSLNGVLVDMTAEEEKEFKAGLPTDSQIAANNLEVLRVERNMKLAETDWTRMDDNGMSDSAKASWATYRQALRDITKDYTSLADVVWPEKP